VASAFPLTFCGRKPFSQFRHGTKRPSLTLNFFNAIHFGNRRRRRFSIGANKTDWVPK
jgi:hypothetical protein